MKRILLPLVLSLALAPAAQAKGPHATIDSGPQGLRPGQPWVATISFVEFRARDVRGARPVVVLRSRFGHRSVRPRLIGSITASDGSGFAEARYRLRTAFPRAGRWTYTVLDGTPANRRFRFPAVTIGGGAARVETGYVAFPEGSRAEREGGGGPIVTSDVPEGPGDGVLPPEVVLPPKDEDDGRGFALWIPAAGLALVAAAATARRRFGRG